jgi:hypothetical protein
VAILRSELKQPVGLFLSSVGGSGRWWKRAWYQTVMKVTKQKYKPQMNCLGSLRLKFMAVFNCSSMQIFG